MFQETFLRATIFAQALVGTELARVTQFEGTTINDLIVRPEFAINADEAGRFLQRVIAL